MGVTELQAALERADRRCDEDWLRSLAARKLEEIEFHDHDRDPSAEETAAAGHFERDTSNKKFYSTVQLSNQ